MVEAEAGVGAGAEKLQNSLYACLEFALSSVSL